MRFSVALDAAAPRYAWDCRSPTQQDRALQTTFAVCVFPRRARVQASFVACLPVSRRVHVAVLARFRAPLTGVALSQGPAQNWTSRGTRTPPLSSVDGSMLYVKDRPRLKHDSGCRKACCQAACAQALHTVLPCADCRDAPRQNAVGSFVRVA